MQPEQDLPDFCAAFERAKPADRAARLSFFRMGDALAMANEVPDFIAISHDVWRPSLWRLHRTKSIAA